MNVEKQPAWNDLIQQKISLMPPELQPPWKDLARAVESRNERRVEISLQKIVSSDSFASPEKKEHALWFAQVLFLCVREAYASPVAGQFEMYTSLLPVFTEFLSRQARHQELREFPKFLFVAGEQFLLIHFDSKTGSEVRFDNFYEFHLQNLREFINSPGFKGWRAQDGVDEFIRICISRWMVHLAHFAQNRRDKPFLNLLDVLMLIFKTAVEFHPLLQGLALVLPCAKKAFHFLYSQADDPVMKVFQRTKQSSHLDFHDTIGAWMQTYNLGGLPDVPRASETEESPELTVPFVYRSLLEEILGDGNISSDEEWAIKNIRDFLDISNERYHRIFEQVQEGRKLNKIPALDRDFSPREFLKKILMKTLEDGVITEEERNILGKVANALLLNQETLAAVFNEAKAAFRSGDAVSPGSYNLETQRLHDVVRHIAMEERVRSVLVSDRGMKTYQKAGKALFALKQKAASLGGEKGVQALGQWAVGAFFFEPQVYLYPTIVLFVESPNIHTIRSQFKGNRIDIAFLEDVQGHRGEDVLIQDRPLLRIFNDGLETEIPLQGILVGDSLQSFMEGFEEVKGKFALMVMHHSSMGAVLALQKAGHLDFSGNFALGLRHMAEGKFHEAVTLFSMIHQGFPDRHEVLYNIAKSYELMFLANPGDAASKLKAMEFFKKELQLNAGSDKAMRGIAGILAHDHNFDEALSWLNRALECAPGSIPNLLGLVEASLARDQEKGIMFSGVPDYFVRFLGEAFHLSPVHPGVLELIERGNSLFGGDLARQFRNQPIQTLFQ